MDDLFVVGISLARSLPFVAVCGVGLMLAIVRWQRHPRVSLLATCGFAILGAVSLVSSFFYALVPSLLSEGLGGESDVGTAMAVYSVIATLINAVAWSLVVWALFVDRKPVS
jgi:hypothetical protein